MKTTKQLYDEMKTWKARYEELPQKKQRFQATSHQATYDVCIEVKPYPVRTKSGLDGGILMVAYVFNEDDWGVKGETVCIPTDTFDFRFGAKLALEKALATTGKFEYLGERRIVPKKVRAVIWEEFNRVLPEKR
jgi:hypothetical protein